MLTRIKHEKEKAMKVKKIGTRMGARIEGIDFEAGLTDTMIDGIANALYENQVIAIPAATMSPEQHLQIALRFGVPEEHATDQFSQHDEVPHITVVDSEAGNRADSWHADETFLEHPPLVNLLYGKLIPETGGDTAFISMAEAYDGLSPKFQDLLEGLPQSTTTGTSTNSAGAVGCRLLLWSPMRSPRDSSTRIRWYELTR
jgi:taurine dioxygenase